MTTETDLLPLPEPVVVAEELEFGAIYAYERRHMEAYARANMEPLLAENERLRAEVDKRQALCEALTAALSSAENSIERIRFLESARAERLAEALRMFLQAGVGNSTDFYVQHNATLAAHAALAQEDRND